MKSKYYIAIFAVILVLCVALSLWFLLPGKSAAMVEIWSDGVLLDTMSLAVPQSLTVGYDGGYNVVTVKNGKVAVTEATCPDQYCVRQGFCSGGRSIVCLPNKLVITFVGDQEIDGQIG